MILMVWTFQVRRPGEDQFLRGLYILKPMLCPLPMYFVSVCICARARVKRNLYPLEHLFTLFHVLFYVIGKNEIMKQERVSSSFWVRMFHKWAYIT